MDQFIVNDLKTAELDDENNEYESKWLWPFPVSGKL